MSWFAAIPAMVQAAGTIADQFDVGGDGGARDRQAFTEAMAREQLQFNKDFATQGVRWRVEDAKAAGIHPGLALGANLNAPSPVTIFGDSGGGRTRPGWSAVGQDIGRAIQAGQSNVERMSELQVENQELQNELLRSQIARNNSAQLGPSFPDPSNPGIIRGQGDAQIVEVPMQRVAGDPAAPWREPGAIVDSGFSRSSTGYAPVPSKDVKDRIEDMGILQWPHALRNNLMPIFDRTSETMQAPPSSWLPIGAVDWRFDPFRQEYFPIDRNGDRIWRF